MKFDSINHDNFYLVTFLIRISILERYVVWCGSKNGYQKDVFKIGIPF